MKKIIRAAWTRDHLDHQKMTHAMLQYRNTPSLRDQLSPAQKLFGKPIQDALPAHRRAFAAQWQKTANEAEKQALTNTEQVESYYNQHTRELPEIRVGSKVAVQDTATRQWETYGVVTAIGPHRRYFIKTMSGRVLVRNRRFLRRRVPLPVPGAISGPPPFPIPPPPPPPLTPAPPPTNHSLPPTHPRRSTRQHTRPSRLIEEIAFTCKAGT